MILSIIVPAYNVEKYLEKCLLSCLHQDIEKNKYEIIVVDDGSPDNSGAIADKIASRYLNVRVIHQTNRGLSGARNEGLQHAKGEYIWFIDSDDWIESNCLYRIVSQLDGIDVLLLQYRKVYENGNPPFNPPFCVSKKHETGKEFLKRSLFPHPAQFAIYRKQFLIENQLFFVEGIYHEDSEFKPRVLYLAESINSDIFVCYNYLQRNSGSITSSYSIKRALDAIFVIENLCKFSDNLPRDDQRVFNVQISIILNEIIHGLKHLSKEDYFQILNVLCRKTPIFKRMCRTKSVKYQLEGLIFSLLLKIVKEFYLLKKKNENFCNNTDF